MSISSPELEILLREFGNAFTLSAALLTPRQREFLDLRWVAHLSVEDAGVALGLSRATSFRLAKYVHRALTARMEMLGWDVEDIRYLFHVLDLNRASTLESLDDEPNTDP